MLPSRLGHLLRKVWWNSSNVLALKVSRMTLTSSNNIHVRTSSSKTMTTALEGVKRELETLRQNETQCFLGTGQYFAHEVNERIVVLSLGELNSLDPPVELLDTEIPSTDIEQLEREVKKLPRCLLLATGEVDSVHEESWEFGFTRSPYLSVFSKSGYNLRLESLKDGHAYRVFNGPLYEDIYLQDVQHLQITLSEEPWAERRLELQLRSGELLTVLEDLREDGSEDLGELMISTEWMVKIGGYLCLTARQLGKCSEVMLKLPEALRAENNPWVELRNKTWSDSVHDQENTS